MPTNLVARAGLAIVGTLGLLSFLGINGCGSQSSGSAAPPPTAPISVSFSSPSASTVSLQADLGKQDFAVTISNDTQNKGVNFTLSSAGCSGAACGVLTNTTLATVTYIAPAVAPPSPVTL